MGKEGFAPSTPFRIRAYAALAIGFFFLAIGMAAVKAHLLKQRFDLAVSDGRFYYAYLPSILIDGDLDFTNQISDHWGPDNRPQLLEDRTPTGAVRNKYPIGLALSVLPGFLLGHFIAICSGGLIPADGYSWPYQVACLAVIELLVWRTLIQIDRLLTIRFGFETGPTFLAVTILATATPYAFYACREPFMVHAVSTFWCVEVVAVVAAASGGSMWFWPRVGLCFSMALVCRPTNIYLVPVMILGIADAVRAIGRQPVLRCIPLAGIALVPLGLQAASWRVLSGDWLYYSYGNERFNWFDPVLWETLFSSRHGLFFWSPICLFGVAGLLTRARDTLIQSWFLGGLALWYLNSAWHCWWFGDSFGARSFIELSGLFAVGLAGAFAFLQAKRWLVWSVCITALVFNLALMAVYISHWISRDGYLVNW